MFLLWLIMMIISVTTDVVAGEEKQSGARALNIFRQDRCSAPDEVLFEIQFTTDTFPQQTSWEIENTETESVDFQSAQYTEQNSEVIETVCLQSDTCYKFSFYDSKGDGLFLGSRQSIYVSYDGKVLVEAGSPVNYFGNEFSLLAGNKCSSTSSLSVSLVPLSFSDNSSSSPITQSEKLEVIDTDSFGRRFFPKRIDSIPMYTYPTIPSLCTENHDLAGCVVVPKHRTDNSVPEWAGKIHAVPPTCNNETKSCQLGIPQGERLSTGNLLIPPTNEVKFTEADVSDISNGRFKSKSVAIADVDKNGWLDVVVGNHARQSNQIFYGSAEGFDERNLPQTSDQTNAITIADLDNDGWLDIIVANGGQPNQILYGSSEGFVDEKVIELPDKGLLKTAAIAVADMDNDGWLDIVVGNNNQINLLLYGSAEGFVDNDENVKELKGGSFMTASVAVADINNDGWVDVVVANYINQNKLLLNERDRNIGFLDVSSEPEFTNSGGQQSRAIALADVNNDGWVDIIIGNEVQHNRLLINSGGSENIMFRERMNLPGGFWKTAALAVADLNNDGWIDVVIGNDGKQPNQFFLNNGSGKFLGQGFNLPGGRTFTKSIAVADMNNDGLNDIIIANAETYISGVFEKNQLILNNLHIGLTDQVLNPQEAESLTYAVAFADVNNDGWIDMVIGNFFLKNQLLLNDGTGKFVDDAIDLPGDVSFTRCLAVGDMNNDGWVDIMIGNSNGSPNHILYNDGNGNFVNEGMFDLPGESSETFALAVADINKDGLLDIVVGNFKHESQYPNQQNEILYGSDLGFTTYDVLVGPPNDDYRRTISVVVADVDNDGWLDILICNTFPQKNYLLLNNRKGAFDIWREIPGGTKNSYSLSVADIDNDGWVDIIVGNSGDSNQLLKNDGNGNFLEPSNLPGESRSTYSLALADVNNDGWLDVIECNLQERNQLLINGDGNGSFINEDIPGGDFSSTSIAIGDVDNDGLLDFVIGNYYEQNVLIHSSTCFTNGGATIHSKSWCFACPSFMGKSYSSCIECAPDFMQDPGTGEECRQQCLNKVRNLGDDECQSCGVGFFLNTTMKRDPLTLWNESKCNLCPPGQYSGFDIALDECYECRPGTYQNLTGAEACSECEPGEFQPDFGKDSCIPCEKGGYCNSTEDSQGGFVPCPPGTYNDQPGQNNVTACKKCHEGTFNPLFKSSSLSSCNACPNGSFSNNTGSTQCEPCPEGTAQNQEGQSFCALCKPGTYGSNTGLQDCINCPFGSMSEEGSPNCPFCDQGFYLADPNVDTSLIFQNPNEHCRKCPKSASCPPNITIESISLQPSSWRLTKRTTRIYSCNTTSNGCSGSRNDTEEYCHDGYEGPLCTLCTESGKYFRKDTKECTQCPRTVYTSLIVFAGVAVLVSFLLVAITPRKRNSSLSWWYDTFSRLGLKEKLKILVSFYQILSSFDDIYGVKLADALVSWLNFLSLDLIGFLPFGCIVKSTVQQFLIRSTWPFFLILVGGLVNRIMVIKRKNAPKEEDKCTNRKWFRNTIQFSIVVVYFTLPIVTKSIFDAIRCQAFQADDGETPSFVSYLIIDMSIQCGDPNAHRPIMILFFILFSIWIVVTPLIILWFLHRISQQIRSQRVSTFAHSLKFLWEDYKSTAWFWDILDIYRRIFLIGLIMFIDIQEGSNRITRLVISAIVSILYLCVLLTLQPYQRKGDLYYALLTNSILASCFVLSIILKVCEEEEGSLESQYCNKFVGSNLNSNSASSLVVILAFGLLVLTIGAISFISYTSITSPSVQIISTMNRPNLQLPEYCTHHIFVSHIWKTGQDAAHAIVRKIQIMVPGLKVWLDVDELDNVSKLEECVENSAVFVLYYSKHYFESWNCRRELYAAMKFDKPMVLVCEHDDGTLISGLIDECTTHCEGDDIDIPSSNTILKKVLGNDFDEYVLWLNEGFYSAAASNLLCYNIFRHLPHYQMNTESLTSGIKVPGEIGELEFIADINILVYKKDEGCDELANELKTSMWMKSNHSERIQIQDAERYFGISNSDIETVDDSDDENTDKDLSVPLVDHEKSFFLLYLNDKTFNNHKGDRKALSTLLKTCFDNGVKIVVVHETDIAKGGCSFDVYLAKAPEEVVKPPISLFNEVSIPLYSKEEYRIVSLKMILKKMGGSFEKRMSFCRTK